MAPITKQYADIYRVMQSLMYAPAMRFYTDANFTDWIQQASTEYASEIGGLHLVDVNNQSVASQSRYAIAAQHRKIRRAFYIKNYGLETEIVAPLEILTDESVNFIKAVSSPPAPNNGFGFSLVGTPVGTPKYCLDRSNQNLIGLLDPPNTTGDTLRLHTLSLPSALGPGVTYDGDEQDVLAIACRACSLGKLKSRDNQESQIFEERARKIMAGYKKMRARQNQVKQAQDMRFLNSNLRSINGGN